MNKQFIPVRLSRLLRDCSVGAVVRTPDYLLTIKDIRHWTDEHGCYVGKEIFYAERVKAFLKLDKDVCLREPPIGVLDKDGKLERGGYGIPVQIFPSWFVCTNRRCCKLHHKPHRHQHYVGLTHMELAQKSAKHTQPRCQSCHSLLEQVSLVQIDQRGYLFDVPWHTIAHSKKQDCKPNWHEVYLTWQRHTNTVSCLRCGSTGTIGIGTARFYQGFIQPWLRVKPVVSETADQAKPTAWVMPVNDARLYSPKNKTALVIPPESRTALGSVVDKLYRHAQKCELANPNKSRLQLKSLKRQLCFEFGCDEVALEHAQRQIEQGYPMYHSLQPEPLPQAEYRALTTPMDFGDDEAFVSCHHTQAFVDLVGQMPDNARVQCFGKLISQVVAVSKLKEILVFTGFSRGGAVAQSEAEPKEVVVPPAIEENIGWLPAVELYGEGIFIGLNEAVLQRWERHPAVIKRVQILQSRYSGSGLNFEDLVVVPRFVLLHALSHLLIKTLESDAGYPAASLKEKIYSSQDPDNPMAGILIYTAIADVDGTLGGLVELCEPRSLLQILTKVYDKMQWCSLDPVCTGHKGQGPAMLNLAACHACLLVPETSCMYGNVLLDRVLLKGDEEVPSVFEMINGGADEC